MTVTDLMSGCDKVVDSRDGFEEIRFSSALMRALAPSMARESIAGHDGTRHVDGNLSGTMTNGRCTRA
jgi:hypothetical protein